MPEIVFHSNTSDFVYPESRSRLRFRVKAEKGRVRNLVLVYFPRTDISNRKEIPLEIMYSFNSDEFWECTATFSKVARYQKYFFKFEREDGKTEYLSCVGVMDKEPEYEFFEFLYANPGDSITTPKWARGCVYYQIFPERFFDGDRSNNPKETEPWGSKPTRENFMGGDLLGIIEKVPYLKELGAECIYLNPIFTADFNHKYATTDYYSIDPLFGTNEDFGNLVKKCHENGIRILLDGVFNHTGINFKPFKDAFEKGKESEYYDWFFFTSEKPMISHHDYECVGAYKYMPKLNTSNPKVREFILDVMDFWIEKYDIDGWRLDVADEVDGTVWNEARYRLKRKYKDILLLGETWGNGGNLLDGKKVDAVMNYCFRDSVRDFFGKDLISSTEFENRIGRMLSSNRTVTNYVQYNLLDSHDTERFLFYCDGKKEKVRTAVAFQMLFLGAPAVYYGDEVGMNGDNDPDCRGAMVWDETADRELLSYYKSLIAFRRNNEAVREGKFKMIFADDENRTIGFERRHESETVTVFIHNRENECSIPMKLLPKGTIYEVNIKGDFTEVSGEEIKLNPYSVIVVKNKED